MLDITPTVDATKSSTPTTFSFALSLCQKGHGFLRVLLLMVEMRAAWKRGREMVANFNKVSLAFMQSIVQTAAVDCSLDAPRVRKCVERTCLQ